MKLLVLISVAMLILPACGGGSTTGTATSGRLSTPSPVVGDIASILPAGWTLVKQRASSDGAYVAIAMSGPERRSNGNVSRMSLSLYQHVAGGLREVARVDASPWMQGIDLIPAHGALDADASGRREITVAFGASKAPGFSTTLRIGPDGVISADASGPVAGETAAVALSTVPPDPLATVESSHRAQDASPTVTIGAPAGAVPAGWALLDSAWSPDGRYVAVVTSPLGPGGFVAQLSLYRIDGGSLRELWREVNGFVYVDRALAFHDVNGDGTPDLVYETSNGGNGATQNATLAVSIDKDGVARDLAFKLPDWASAPARAIDIDGDGVYEWVVVDASWELRGFCHACSPGSRSVLAWGGSAYSDASARFGDWIVAQGQEPQLPADTSCRAQDAYMSQLVSRFLDYTNAHRGSDATRVLAALSSFAWSPEFAAKRDAIVAALRADPHHPGEIPDVICQE